MPQSREFQESSSERHSRLQKEIEESVEKVQKKWADSFSRNLIKMMNKQEEEFKKKERLLQGVIVVLCILCVILFMNMAKANSSVQATKEGI